MWLASISRRNHKNEIIASSLWATGYFTCAGKRETAKSLLHVALRGLGDPAREKFFRMNITVCVHRGTRPEERERLQGLKPGMAGAPVEILEEIGVETPLSARPCLAPGHKQCADGRPDLWLPIDCGVCPSCLARIRVQEGNQR